MKSSAPLQKTNKRAKAARYWITGTSENVFFPSRRSRSTGDYFSALLSPATPVDILASLFFFPPPHLSVSLRLCLCVLPPRSQDLRCRFSYESQSEPHGNCVYLFTHCLRFFLFFCSLFVAFHPAFLFLTFFQCHSTRPTLAQPQSPPQRL